MADVHEAKKKRAGERGQGIKREGNKVLGDEDEDREVPEAYRYRGAGDHTKDRPGHPQKRPLYAIKKSIPTSRFLTYFKSQETACIPDRVSEDA